MADYVNKASHPLSLRASLSYRIILCRQPTRPTLSNLCLVSGKLDCEGKQSQHHSNSWGAQTVVHSRKWIWIQCYTRARNFRIGDAKLNLVRDGYWLNLLLSNYFKVFNHDIFLFFWTISWYLFCKWLWYHPLVIIHERRGKECLLVLVPSQIEIFGCWHVYFSCFFLGICWSDIILNCNTKNITQLNSVGIEIVFGPGKLKNCWWLIWNDIICS